MKRVGALIAVVVCAVPLCAEPAEAQCGPCYGWGFPNYQCNVVVYPDGYWSPQCNCGPDMYCVLSNFVNGVVWGTIAAVFNVPYGPQAAADAIAASARYRGAGELADDVDAPTR